jgi:hypothetical protein
LPGFAVQLDRGFGLSRALDVGGEIVRGTQGVRVIVAEQPAEAGASVFVQVTGRPQLPKIPQVDGEIAR